MYTKESALKDYNYEPLCRIGFYFYFFIFLDSSLFDRLVVVR